MFHTVISFSKYKALKLQSFQLPIETITSTMASSEDLFLNRAKFVMKYLGVWVPVENESVLHTCYRIFMMTLQYLFLIFQIIYIIQVWGDLEAVSQASYLLFTQACLCLKVTVFQMNMGTLKELLRLMDSGIFRPEKFAHET